MAYATIAQLKNEIKKSNADADAYLPDIIDAASLLVDKATGREEGFYTADTVASARYYQGSGRAWQRIDPCVEITTVSVKSTWGASSFTAWSTPTTSYAGDGDWYPAAGDPKHPLFSRLPYTLLYIDPNGDYSRFTAGSLQLPGGLTYDDFVDRVFRETNPITATVQVTAKWGYAVTTPAIIVQATIMQAARMYRRLEASMADSLASTEFGELLFTQEMDPDVRNLLVNGRLIKPVV